MLHVFVGWDPRENEAYEVCRHSIIRHSSEPVVVTPLKRASLEASGSYWRKHEVRDGQRYDLTDGRPFSTEFSFTRFLVPHVARTNNLHGRVAFVDCDFMFLDDIAFLFDEAEHQDADLCVVKHNYVPAAQRKMDNCVQEPYNRKLWSSLMIFNPWSASALRLTPDFVNSATGATLHQLQWIDDDRIGTLSERWNWIPDVSPTTGATQDEIGAVHWTEGGPCLPGYENVPYAEEYRKELALINASRFSWNHLVQL